MAGVGLGQQVAGEPGLEEPTAAGEGELEVVPAEPVAQRRGGERAATTRGTTQEGAASHGAGRHDTTRPGRRAPGRGRG